MFQALDSRGRIHSKPMNDGALVHLELPIDELGKPRLAADSMGLRIATDLADPHLVEVSSYQAADPAWEQLTIIYDY